MFYGELLVLSTLFCGECCMLCAPYMKLETCCIELVWELNGYCFLDPFEKTP